MKRGLSAAFTLSYAPSPSISKLTRITSEKCGDGGLIMPMQLRVARDLEVVGVMGWGIPKAKLLSSFKKGWKITKQGEQTGSIKGDAQDSIENLRNELYDKRSFDIGQSKFISYSLRDVVRGSEDNKMKKAKGKVYDETKMFCSVQCNKKSILYSRSKRGLGISVKIIDEESYSNNKVTSLVLHLASALGNAKHFSEGGPGHGLTTPASKIIEKIPDISSISFDAWPTHDGARLSLLMEVDEDISSYDEKEVHKLLDSILVSSCRIWLTDTENYLDETIYTNLDIIEALSSPTGKLMNKVLGSCFRMNPYCLGRNTTIGDMKKVAKVIIDCLSEERV